MMRKSKYIFCLALFIITAKTYSQQPRVGTWYQHSLSARLSDKFRLATVAQYRTYGIDTDLRVFLVGPNLSYEITKGINIESGFLYLAVAPYDKNRLTRHEIRPHQSITLSNTFGKVSVSHRFRIEERFRSNPNQYITRLRYLLNIKVPFDKNKKYYGNFRNEIRINQSQTSDFDSDRISLIAGYQLNKKSAFELGIIEEVENGPNSTYIYLGYRNSFNWIKKNKK